MTTLTCDACLNTFDSSRDEPLKAQILCPDCVEDKDRDNQKERNADN